MKKIISGKNIYFRKLVEDDIDLGWLEWINDEEITRHLRVVPPVSKNELKKYYYDSQYPDAVMFAVCDIDTDLYIGNARLCQIDWENKNCVYGRMIGRKEYYKKGIGTEMLAMLMEYAFYQLGMHRIWTEIIPSNIGSVKSNIKAGLSKEGLRREAKFVNGKFEDLIMFSMLKQEYDQLYKQ